MFTGIVETSGILRSRSARGSGARLSIDTPMSSLVLGESIAVQGACLTVQNVSPSGFEADASCETLTCTTLGGLPIGARLHLERALTLQTRLGGHLVTGHIDGRLRLVNRIPGADSMTLTFEICDAMLAKFIAKKGSVAIDGVSLTVNRVAGVQFDVAIIPHTQEVTTLGELALGDASNFEVDLMARYAERLLETGPAHGPHSRPESP